MKEGFLMPERQTLAYDIQFDIDSFDNLKRQEKVLTFEEFNTQREKQQEYFSTNLKSALGERYNLEKFSYSFPVIEGKIFNPGQNENFENTIKRGVNHRKTNENQADREREKAEALGFERIQELITGSEFDGNIVIISPPGSEKSSYQLSFYHIWQKTKSNQVKCTTFTSSLDSQESLSAAKELDNKFPDAIALTDAHFLKHPIVTKKTTEEIQKQIKAREDVMLERELENVFEACAPLVANYIENPNPQTYNAILAAADKIVFESDEKIVNLIAAASINNQIREITSKLAQAPIRTVMTGCGAQGGVKIFGVGKTMLSFIFSPISVSFFGSESEDTSDFPCPECGHIIKYGSGTKECPGCGMKATCT